MFRKLLMVAAATAVPLGVVAVGAVGAGQAGAATPVTYPNIACAVGGTVNFAPPGLSYMGSVTPNKTSTTDASGITYSGCSGGPNTNGGGPFTLAIVTKNTKCPKVATNASPTWSCQKPNYQYDTTSGFTQSSTLTDVKKAVKKLGLNVDGIVFKNKPFSVSQVAPGGVCGSEVGFEIQSNVKSKAPKTTYLTATETACLGSDSGPGTTGNFLNDFISAAGGNTAITIATAQIDPAFSSLAVNN